MRLIDADALTDALIYADLSKAQQFCYPCKRILEEIKNAPTIEPERRWIPCSERLPEDVEIGEEYPTVIFCDSDGKVYVGFYEYGIYGNKWWNNTDWNDVVDDVVAWMPLPEPWKGEE